jgi:serine/threonine-protein kinase
METREALQRAVKGKQWKEATEALLRLAERDPGALRERKVAVAARVLAASLASLPGRERADSVFHALAMRLGPEGPALLYEIIETRGKSAPALRSVELLRKAEVAAVATPATRIAFELRDAPCDRKLTLLDRAVADGDKRALYVLETVVLPCFGQSRPVSEAIKKLKGRLSG